MTYSFYLLKPKTNIYDVFIYLLKPKIDKTNIYDVLIYLRCIHLFVKT